MSKKSILIADDNYVNRIILVNLLKNTYDTYEAADGQETLEILFSGVKIDAVLLDIVMPKINGFDVLITLRGKHGFEKLPVIVMTSSETTDTEVKALNYGANDFIEKPFKPDIILTRLDNAMLLQKALIDAETDSLTGLLNRTAFQHRTENYLEYCENSGEIAALTVIDIDNFKNLNDSMGHAYGDKVLQTFSAILNNESGENLISGRLGGDEFVVLFKNSDDKSVADVLNKIQTKFNSADVDGVKSVNTCSIGVAMVPDNGKNWNDLYFCADEAMYESKRLGRNQFTFYNKSNDFMRRTPEMGKEWILDELDIYIYICDAETHEVYYTNSKSGALLRSLSSNDDKCFCYQLGLNKCPFCFCSEMPLSGKKVTTAEVENVNGKRMLYKSKLIFWNGRLSRMTMVSEID